MDTATNVPQLFDLLSKKRYEVFFIAPGMCNVLGEDGIVSVQAKIQEMQPHIKCIEIRGVSEAINQLSEALNAELPAQELKPLSEAWPFVD